MISMRLSNDIKTSELLSNGFAENNHSLILIATSTLSIEILFKLNDSRKVSACLSNLVQRFKARTCAHKLTWSLSLICAKLKLKFSYTTNCTFPLFVTNYKFPLFVNNCTFPLFVNNCTFLLFVNNCTFLLFATNCSYCTFPFIC